MGRRSWETRATQVPVSVTGWHAAVPLLGREKTLFLSERKVGIAATAQAPCLAVSLSLSLSVPGVARIWGQQELCRAGRRQHCDTRGSFEGKSLLSSHGAGAASWSRPWLWPVSFPSVSGQKGHRGSSSGQSSLSPIKLKTVILSHLLPEASSRPGMQAVGSCPCLLQLPRQTGCTRWCRQGRELPSVTVFQTSADSKCLRFPMSCKPQCREWKVDEHMVCPCSIAHR